MCEFTWNLEKIRTYSNSRSSLLVPVDSAYAISYLLVITGCAAYLPSPTLRSHEWCATLVAGSGVSRIQDRCADLRSSLWRRAPVSGTIQPRCRCIWSTLSPHLWHQPSRSTPLRLSTVVSRSFPVAAGRHDLERTVGQSRLHNVITVLSAPSDDIILFPLPAVFHVALQWT